MDHLDHKHFKGTGTRVLLIATCLFLSACGGGPSKSDVTKAVKSQVANLAQMMGGDASKVDSLNVDVGDITKQADGTYIAIYSVNGTAGTIKLAKTGGGWQVLTTQ